MQTQASRRWPASAIVVAVVLSLLLAIAGTASVFGFVNAGRLREENRTLQERVTATESRIEDLEAALAAAEGQGTETDSFGGLGDLLGGLLSGGENGDLGALDDLLGGLLGETGNLDDLFGDLGGGLDMQSIGQCLTTPPGAFTIGEASLHEQVDDIAAAVEELRDLRFQGEIDPVFVTPEEMSERVRALATEDYPPAVAELETRLWVALRMLPEGFDLLDEQLDLLEGAVAGYYDPDSQELVVASLAGEEPLGAADQVTLAHELIHALTDSRLGFPDSLDDPAADPERARAIQALIEGDATLGMQQFSMGAIDLFDQFGMMLDPRFAASQQDLADFPYLLSNSLQLPYFEGMSFACALHADGGWDRVDEAYDDPPTTTVEILFPELYFAGWEPAEPLNGGDPGTDWTLLDDIGTGGAIGFGAVDLLYLFSAPGDDTHAALADARERTRAWGGGLAKVWSRGEETAVLLSLVDGNTGDHRLCDSLSAWELSAFGADEANVIIDCREDNVLVAIAPDQATATDVLG